MDLVTKGQNMIKGELNRVYAAVDALAEMEGQDVSLVIQMSQAMINDILETGELKDMAEYVRRYCDVYDSPEEAQEIADNI